MLPRLSGSVSINPRVTRDKLLQGLRHCLAILSGDTHPALRIAPIAQIQVPGQCHVSRVRLGERGQFTLISLYIKPPILYLYTPAKYSEQPKALK